MSRPLLTPAQVRPEHLAPGEYWTNVCPWARLQGSGCTAHLQQGHRGLQAHLDAVHGGQLPA